MVQTRYKQVAEFLSYCKPEFYLIGITCAQYGFRHIGSTARTVVSPGCGFATFFNLDTVISTRHTIQSLLINQKAITSTTNDTAHITLYFGI